MKKLIAITISLIFILEGASYGLRPQLISGRADDFENDKSHNLFKPRDPQVEHSIGHWAGRKDMEALRMLKGLEEPERTFWAWLERTMQVKYCDLYVMDELRKYMDKILPGEGLFLDLMSGRESVFSVNPRKNAKGVGLTTDAMSENPVLKGSFKKHNLNIDPEIPYRDEFDAVIISFGIMYLTRPVEVSRGVYKILRPGGSLHIIFFDDDKYAQAMALNVWNFPSLYDVKDRLDIVYRYLKIAGFPLENINNQEISPHLIVVSATKPVSIAMQKNKPSNSSL